MQLSQKHPELLVWEQCIYKVFPFNLNNGNDEFRSCQCRVVVLDWNNNSNTLNQYNIINGILMNWYMLEKFQSVGNKQVSDEYNLTSEHFSGLT